MARSFSVRMARVRHRASSVASTSNLGRFRLLFLCPHTDFTFSPSIASSLLSISLASLFLSFFPLSHRYFPNMAPSSVASDESGNDVGLDTRAAVTATNPVGRLHRRYRCHTSSRHRRCGYLEAQGQWLLHHCGMPGIALSGSDLLTRSSGCSFGHAAYTTEDQGLQ